MAGSPATLAGGLGPSLGSAPSASLALASVPFRGGHLLAAQLEGEVWVPIRPVCEALGLAWQPQLKKLRAKPWANTCDTFMVSEGDDQRRRFSCVDLRSLPLWLATIEPSRVKPEAREALVAYQREAAEVLFKHFLAPPAPAGAALGADVGAKLNETRGKLAEAMWALGLPARESPDLDPASAEALAEGGASGGLLVTVAPELPAGEALEELSADVAHLGVLLGFEPRGGLPDGVLIPQIDSRSQTVLRLRAWLLECTRPLTDEERQGRASRGITAQQAADSYNRWAWGRGLGPLSAATMGRWLADSAVSGYRRTLSRKGHRYQLALLPAAGGLVALPRRCALWPASTTRRPAKTSPRPGASMSGSRS